MLVGYNRESAGPEYCVSPNLLITWFESIDSKKMEGSPRGYFQDLGESLSWGTLDATASMALPAKSALHEARRKAATLYYKRATGFTPAGVGRKSNDTRTKILQCQVLAEAYANDVTDEPVDEWFRGPTAAAIFKANSWIPPVELLRGGGGVDQSLTTLYPSDIVNAKRAAALAYFKRELGVQMNVLTAGQPDTDLSFKLYQCNELSEAYAQSLSPQSVEEWYRSPEGAKMLQEINWALHRSSGRDAVFDAGAAISPTAQPSAPSQLQPQHLAPAPPPHQQAVLLQQRAAAVAAAQVQQAAAYRAAAAAAVVSARPPPISASKPLQTGGPHAGSGYLPPGAMRTAQDLSKRSYHNPLMRGIYTSAFHRWDDEGNHIGWVGIKEWRAAILELVGQDVPLSTSYTWRKAEQVGGFSGGQ